MERDPKLAAAPTSTSDTLSEAAPSGPSVHDAALRRALQRRRANRQAGKPLPAEVRADMEASFNTDFGAVRIHEDGAANEAGATAFAQGDDVHFAAGAYDPHSEAGAALLGHELAHVVQQRAGGVSPQAKDHGVFNADAGLEAAADAAGERAAAGKPAHVETSGGGSRTHEDAAAPMQPKLEWNRKTFEARTGTRGKLGASAEWRRIGATLDQYNRLEDVAKEGLAAKPILQRMQASGLAWLDKHEDDTDREKQKLRRRVEAVEDLALRDIPHELGAIESHLRGGRTQKKLGGGVVSDVNLVEFEGHGARVFKDHQQDYPGVESAQEALIPHGHNSLLGNRSVATSKLDTLFGTDVIAQTEYGERQDQYGNTKKGIVMDVAPGVTPNLSIPDPFGPDSTVELHRVLDYTDPDFQRELATLQLLDCITGQVDRHPGNYFVHFDGGRVKVTGIDNDFSFGKGKTTTDRELCAYDKLKAFPVWLDRDVALRVRAITEDQLRATLQGYLTKPEIDMTVRRFREAVAFINNMELTGHLLTRDQWTREHAQREVEEGSESSYLGAIKHQTLERHQHAKAIPFDPDEDPRERRAKEVRYTELWPRLYTVMTSDHDQFLQGKGTQFGDMPPGQLRFHIEQALQEIYRIYPAFRTHPFYVRLNARKAELPEPTEHQQELRSAPERNEAPIPGRLGWTRDRFVKETGTGKTGHSEHWKNIVRAIDLYNGYDDTGSKQALKLLGQIQRLAWVWLDKERTDDRKQALSERIAVVTQLAERDIPAEQDRVLAALKLDYEQVAGRGEHTNRTRDVGEVRQGDRWVRNKVGVGDNGELFREITDEHSNGQYDAPQESNFSKDEKIHVPARAEDIERRTNIVTATCLEHGVVNWKTTRREKMENKRSGTARIVEALVAAELVKPEEIREDKLAYQYQMHARAPERRGKLVAFLRHRRELGDNLNEVDETTSDEALFAELAVAVEGLVGDAFPTEQNGREITIYAKRELKTIEGWTELANVLHRRFEAAKLPKLPIADGDAPIQGASVDIDGVPHGYFSMRNEEEQVDPVLGGPAQFPHWIGSQAREARAGDHELQFDQVRVDTGGRRQG